MLVESTAGPSTTLRSGPTASRGRRDDKSRRGALVSFVAGGVYWLTCQAIFTSERRPGRGTLPTIFFAISSDAVAAGEGALQT